MRTLLAALLALAAGGPALAQDAPADTLVLTPGDGALTTDWLTPGTESYTVRLVEPMQQNVGTVTETIAIDGGTVTRVTTVSVPMQGLTQTDSLVADAATFAPRSHNSTGGAVDVAVEFMPEGVAGMVTPRAGAATPVALMTDAPVFDSGWIGEVAQSLPLAEGLVARVAAFSAQSTDAPVQAVLSVTGQEAVATAGGDRTAWVVEADLGTAQATYLVDAETRALHATRFSPQPGVTIEIAPAE